MTRPEPAPRRAFSWLDLARALFLLAAVAFGWWGLRSRGTEIAEALAQTSPPRVLSSCVLVLVGLSITGAVWRRILAGFGHPVPARDASAIFFVGQLGKYIPGSVWSLGAQADMARRFHVPARTTVAVGLVFLWVNVVTAVPVGALLADLSTFGILGSPLVRLAAFLLGLGAMTPPVLSRIGRVLAKSPEPLAVGWPGSAAFLAMMATVWSLYGAAATLVVPPPALTAAGGAAAVVLPVIGAFAISYVVGVLVVLAPAGVGAREVALIALLTPAIGLTAAAATALLIRAVHTVCDFGIAGASWLLARGGRTAPIQDSAGMP